MSEFVDALDVTSLKQRRNARFEKYWAYLQIEKRFLFYTSPGTLQDWIPFNMYLCSIYRQYAWFYGALSFVVGF